MPRLSPISSRNLIRIVEKMGFSRVRQEGSHTRYSHSDGRKVTIPVHPGENIHRGLLRKIIRDLHLTPEQFSRLR